MPGGTAKVTTEALESLLAREYGASASVTNLHRMSGGASRETWSFDVTEAGGATHGLVLRRDPAVANGASDRAVEYQLLQAAARAKVPVPRVFLLLEPDDGLGRGFVMERVEGETIARRILRDDEYASARPLLAEQCGRIAAQIHSVPRAELSSLTLLGVTEQLDQYRSVLDTFGEPHPAFELGLRYLADRAPDAAPDPCFVHGDYRLGNLIIGPDGVRAVLDWELAHLGDPIEDLGWLCVKSWRFGNAERVVGGFGDVEQLLDGYEAVSGLRPDVERLRYWVVFGTMKWGVICISQAFTHLNGIVRSVELATIGRRVAEMEWDLLNLLEGGW